MLNSVSFVGRLTRNVELKYTPNGIAFAKIGLAVQQKFRDKNTGKYEADFLDVEVWGVRAENVSLYCKKGSLISVQGELRTRNYENDSGNRKYVYILADNISYLDPKEKIETEEANVSYEFFNNEGTNEPE